MSQVMDKHADGRGSPSFPQMVRDLSAKIKQASSLKKAQFQLLNDEVSRWHTVT
jgi:hypothetical protein